MSEHEGSAPATDGQRRRIASLRRDAGLEPLPPSTLAALTYVEAAELIRAMKPRGIGAAIVADAGGLFD